MSKLDELLQELCPNGVKFRSLDKCCIILDSKRKPVTKALRKSGIYPYYGANGIQDHISEYIYDGTFILIGEDGSVITPNGTPVVTWASGKIWVNNHAHVLSESTDVSLRYLFHFIQTINIAPLVHGNIPKLTGSDLRAISIPVPPLEVQREIVRILDSFTSLTAELSAELSTRQNQYGFYREKLLSFAPTVTWKTLGDIGKVSMCKRIMKNETSSSGEIPFYKIGTFGKEADAYISKDLFEKYKAQYSYPKKGDILISAAGTIGRTVVFDGKPAYFQDSNIVWVANDETQILNRFLLHWYATNPWKVSTGGTISRLYNDNIANAKVPVPPLDVQQRIVNVLDNFDAICSDLNIGLPAEISARQKQYEYYRDLLLSFKNIDNITERQTEHN